ncbi:hypothetical protein DS731_13395 [Alteromonas sp. RKMC-009]|nr:hypothetical protein DS731_13395 [Alteromonas sp. RKMC-009]
MQRQPPDCPSKHLRACNRYGIVSMPGHHAMRRFYLQFDFVVTEEDDEDGVVMELMFNGPNGLLTVL